MMESGEELNGIGKDGAGWWGESDQRYLAKPQKIHVKIEHIFW